MRVDAYDSAVAAALEAAHAADLFVIMRLQDTVERRLTLVNGGMERQRTTSLAGLGIHAFTQDGAVGFASVDDLRPEAARETVRRAGAMARAAQELDAARTLAPFSLVGGGRDRLLHTLPVRNGGEHVSPARDSEEHASPAQAASAASDPSRDLVQPLTDAQSALSDIPVGEARTVRTSHHAVDEEWRIARSDGTDLSFGTPRAVTRHDLS